MKNIIDTPEAPAPIGPYSQGVQAGNMLFISGQIAIDAITDSLVIDNIELETTQVMQNLLSILERAGYTAADVVKTTIFLSDMSHFPKVNDVYGSYFTSTFPARETVAVAGLPKGVNVEISAIAYKE
jgi:2-iminobutanoate/2-iminopropanoate deaminase